MPLVWPMMKNMMGTQPHVRICVGVGVGVNVIYGHATAHGC